LQAKILLLEDDIPLSETVCEFLEESGFIVTPVYDGISAQDILYEKQFDLLLLDVKVPELNGFEVLKAYREERSGAPAIFITSLNSVDDVEHGFESGCDDYIKKPFELKELLVRVKSLLKRSFLKSASEMIDLGDGVAFDIEGMNLQKNGEIIKLQEKELRLLKLLLQKRNELVTHEEIYTALWEYDEESSDESLRTYIKNIRKIVGKEQVVSLKKLGYKFIL